MPDSAKVRCPSRRQALAGISLGALAGALVGCESQPVPDEGAAESSGGVCSTGSGVTPESGEVLGGAADIPVGGGRVYPDQEVVVTQPTEGEFRGFSAVCTHQGSIVAEVSEGTIVCACHNSTFSIEDGSPVQGPAPDPLPAVEVAVEGEEVVVA